MKVTKEMIHHAGEKAWRTSGGFLFVLFSMGTGKTKLCIDRIREVVNQIFMYAPKVLFIAHDVHSKLITIPEEFEKWGASSLLKLGVVKIVHQGQIPEMKGEQYDLVIYDEVHLINENRYKFFEQNLCKRIILVTGTQPTDSHKRQMIRKLSKGNSVVYTMDDAVKYGTINDYEIKVVYVEPDDKEKYKMKGYGKLMTEWEHYLARCENVQRAKDSGAGSIERMKQAGVGRTWVLKKSPSKLKAAIYLNRNIKEKGNKKRIIFCPTGAIAHAITPNGYFGNHNEVVFDAFNADAIKEMAVVGKIREGSNINNLTVGIVMNVDKKDENFLQKFGRMLRGEPGVDISTIYIICLKNTVDEDNLRASLKSIPTSKITTFNLSREKLDLIPVNYELME